MRVPPTSGGSALNETFQRSFTKTKQEKVTLSEKTINEFLNMLEAAGRSEMRIKGIKYGLEKIGKIDQLGLRYQITLQQGKKDA